MARNFRLRPKWLIAFSRVSTGVSKSTTTKSIFQRLLAQENCYSLDLRSITLLAKVFSGTPLFNTAHNQRISGLTPACSGDLRRSLISILYTTIIILLLLLLFLRFAALPLSSLIG